MTIYKTLKETVRNDGMTVTAYEYIEKYSNVKNYIIVESKDGIGLFVSRCAATTWKRKFKQISNN